MELNKQEHFAKLNKQELVKQIQKQSIITYYDYNNKKIDYTIWKGNNGSWNLLKENYRKYYGRNTDYSLVQIDPRLFGYRAIHVLEKYFNDDILSVIKDCCGDYDEGVLPHAFEFYCGSIKPNCVTMPLLRQLEKKHPGLISRAFYLEYHHGDTIPLMEAINTRNFEMATFLIDECNCRRGLFYHEMHGGFKYSICFDRGPEMNKFLKDKILEKFSVDEINKEIKEHKKDNCCRYEGDDEELKCYFPFKELLEFVKKRKNFRSS